jgi:hypothetical protein
MLYEVKSSVRGFVQNTMQSEHHVEFVNVEADVNKPLDWKG